MTNYFLTNNKSRKLNISIKVILSLNGEVLCLQLPLLTASKKSKRKRIFTLISLRLLRKERFLVKVDNLIQIIELSKMKVKLKTKNFTRKQSTTKISLKERFTRLDQAKKKT